MKTIYRFKSLEEIDDNQKAFYANNFLILYHEKVYFKLYDESLEQHKYNLKRITGNSLYSKVKIIPLGFNTNINKYMMFRSIHNGLNTIEAKSEFIKEATQEDMKNDGILSEVVAMRLRGEL